MKHYLKIFILLTLFCLLLAAPVAAQQDNLIVSTNDPQVAFVVEAVVKAFYNAVYLPFAAGMVVILVALTKRLPVINRIHAAVLSLWWTAILWLLYTGATQLGFGGQFETVVQLLTTLGAAALGITFTPMLASQVYSRANKQGVAVLGYKRPERTVSTVTVQAEPILADR